LRVNGGLSAFLRAASASLRDGVGFSLVTTSP
jgi:hypothetical protein